MFIQMQERKIYVIKKGNSGRNWNEIGEHKKKGLTKFKENKNIIIFLYKTKNK